MTAFVLAVTIGSAFATGSSDDNSAKTVSLRVSTYYTTVARAKGYPGVVEAFQEANPGVEVDLWATNTGYHDAIRTQFSAGEAPDVVGTTHDRFMDYARNGMLMDMTDVFYENGLDASLYGLCAGWGKFGDKIYGIADSPAPIEWYYNVDIFEKLGLSEPKNLDELIDVSKTIADAGYIPVMWGAQDTWTGTAVLGMITAQIMGLDPVNAAVESGDWDLQGLRDALAIVEDFRDSGVIDPSMTGVSYESSIDLFIKGKVAMFPMGSWVISNFEAAKPADFRYSSFDEPVLFTDKPFAPWSASGGQVFVIPKNTENKDAAVAFLLHMFSDESQISIAQEGNMLSSSSAANGMWNQDIYKIALAHLKETTKDSGMLVDYLPSRIRDGLGAGIRSLINGETTADEIVSNLAP